MIYGYARVSTKDQNLNLQLDALKAAGCQKIFSEKVSAARERPELEKLIGFLQPGDTVIVWKLDRLARSLKDLIKLVSDFKERSVYFISVQDKIDTASAQGRLIFNIFASLAEFERDLIRERTVAGLDAARARGNKGGRPEGLSQQAEIKAMAVYHLYQDNSLSISQIIKETGVSVATLYKYIRYIEKKQKTEPTENKKKRTLNP